MADEPPRIAAARLVASWLRTSSGAEFVDLHTREELPAGQRHSGAASAFECRTLAAFDCVVGYRGGRVNSVVEVPNTSHYRRHGGNSSRTHLVVLVSGSDPTFGSDADLATTRYPVPGYILGALDVFQAGREEIDARLAQLVGAQAVAALWERISGLRKGGRYLRAYSSMLEVAGAGRG
jgi:hypothetical protein